MIRHFVFIHYILSLALLGFIFTSCDPRSCEDVICPVNSECYLGECLCPAGFEGANCDILSYNKYLGNYQVNESCPGSPIGGNNYSASIIKSSFNDASSIIITNMLGLGLSAEAQVSGNFISIPNQNLGATQIEGTGEYDEITQRVIIYYQYVQSGQVYQCTAYFTKF